MRAWEAAVFLWSSAPGFSNVLSLSCASHRSRERKLPPWRPSTMGNPSLKPEWTLTYPGSAWSITQGWQDLWQVRTLLEFALCPTFSGNSNGTKPSLVLISLRWTTPFPEDLGRILRGLSPVLPCSVGTHMPSCELAGVKLCLCSQAEPDLTPGGSDQTGRGFALFYLLAVSLQVNTSSFLGDPLGTLGENRLGCVLGLEPGITLSRLPAGSLARPWLAVMETFCPHKCLFKAK